MTKLDRFISGTTSDSVMEDLYTRFTGYRPSPTRTRQDDMYAEGQRQAVEWIAHNQPPHFNDDFYERAEQALKLRNVSPKKSFDQIMLEAGKASVLPVLKARTVTKTVTGDPSKLRGFINSAIKWGKSKLSKFFG